MRAAANQLAESGERVHETVYDFQWEGLSRNAADTRADRELTQDRTVAADLHALADAYENGKNTMQPMIDGLNNKAQGLEADHFAVSEDWVVTDTYDYAAAKKLAKLMGLPGKLGMDGSAVWGAWQEGRIDEIRDYCETDVVNTFLVYLRFQRMRGVLTAKAFEAELQTVRSALEGLKQPHWQAFLAAWEA